MNTIQKWSGVAALVILAILAATSYLGEKGVKFGTAVNCTSNTCLSGGFGLTTGPFQVDGNSIFNGNVTMTGTPSFTGNVAITGNLSVTGTTTLQQSLILADSDSASCMQFFATSTATADKLVFYATSTPAAVNAVGFLAYQYGTCN